MMDFQEQEKILKGFYLCMLGLALAIGLTIGAIVVLLLEHEAAKTPEQIVNQEEKGDRLLILPEQMRQ